MDRLPRDVTPADLLDVDGRPIGEWASRRYAEVETEIVGCPYPDRRRGLPMSRTALRQLSSVWSEVTSAMAALAGPGATVHRAWRAAIAATAAPAVHHGRFGTPIPRVLSAAYKGGLGFSQVLTALLLADDGVADAPLPSLGDADAFFSTLDEGSWLVGQEQVCAGPQAMIASGFEALCGRGEARFPPAFAALDPVDPWVDTAVVRVALRVAYMGHVRLAALTGDAPGERLHPSEPWLRGVVGRPGHQPEHALRLFETGRAPPAVVRFVRLDPAPVTTWDARLDEATIGLDEANDRGRGGGDGCRW